MQHRVRRAIFVAATVLASVASLALLVGIGYQTYRDRYLMETYSPPGRMVDIGTHRLHMYCEGQGAPPVLLEAGSSIAGTGNWEPIHAALSETTRTCIYDRSGLGWSELGPTPPSALQATDELALLLDESGIKGPWVMVGHSLGGLYVAHFLDRFPDRVAGLVLLDALGENLFDIEPRYLERVTPDATARLRPLLVRAGLHRLSLPRVPESDPTWVNRQLHATVQHVMRGDAEWYSLPRSAEHVQRARAESWGDTPVVILRAGRNDWAAANWPDSIVSAMSRAMAEAETVRAGRSSRGTVRLLEDTGHGIPWERPQVVVAVVDSMIGALRAAPSPDGADRRR